jgi:hypothetical protein
MAPSSSTPESNDCLDMPAAERCVSGCAARPAGILAAAAASYNSSLNAAKPGPADSRAAAWPCYSLANIRCQKPCQGCCTCKVVQTCAASPPPARSPLPPLMTCITLATSFRTYITTHSLLWPSLQGSSSGKLAVSRQASAKRRRALLATAQRSPDHTACTPQCTLMPAEAGLAGP